MLRPTLPTLRPILYRTLVVVAWTSIVLAMTMWPLILKAAPTGALTASKISRIDLPPAGKTVQCAYNGAVVPCEIVPTTLLDRVEAKNKRLKAKLDAEVRRHNTTLDLLDTATREAVSERRAAEIYKAERDLAREELANQTPSWVYWTVTGVALVLGGGGGFWLGTKL